MVKYLRLKRQLDQLENNSSKSEFDDALLNYLSNEIIIFLKEMREMAKDLFGSPAMEGISEEDAQMTADQWLIRLKDMNLSQQLKERILENYKKRDFDYLTMNWLIFEPDREELSNQMLDEKIKEIEAWFELNT